MSELKDWVSEKSWKLRCKLQTLGQSTEKTLSDYESNNLALSGPDVEAHVSPGQPVASNDVPSPGSNASVKTLYEGPNSNENRFDWVDYPPRQPSKKVAKAQERVAITLYKIKDTDKPVVNGRYYLRHHKIEVQNRSLIAALSPILVKENIHLDTHEPAQFHEPFRPLWFCYDAIVDAYKVLEEQNPQKTFMLLFIKVLDEVFEETRAKNVNLQAKGLVSFDTAWTYFATEAPVLAKATNCEFLGRVVNTSYVKGCGISLKVELNVMKFNGTSFVWKSSAFHIPKFSGNRPITQLTPCPVEFLEHAAWIQEKMTGRGRLMLDYQGLSYCNYDGISLFDTGEELQKHNVSGRILIDVVGYHKHHLVTGNRENIQIDNNSNVQTAVTKSQRLCEEDQRKNKVAMLARPNDLMYMFPMIEGFALKNKLWLSFFIEDVRPIVWNDQAFSHLVYDEQQKDLVASFVQSHGHSTQQQLEDVIVGKGQGLILLLSGPPGTGKTLMAEAVADRTHRPLFYLQAEDLGISAATLGEKIKKVFQMATEWDAVILLDEADVFMAERKPQDISRNELVSIFLRELEYFQGIIFLTTNLYETVDTAFRSRVSLHLLFQPLSTEARMIVWRKFLNRLPRSGKVQEALGEPGDLVPNIAGEDIRKLAEWELNGREIKNAVRIVKLWCDQEGYELTFERFEKGIKVTNPYAIRHT